MVFLERHVFLKRMSVQQKICNVEIFRIKIVNSIFINVNNVKLLYIVSYMFNIKGPPYKDVFV